MLITMGWQSTLQHWGWEGLFETLQEQWRSNVSPSTLSFVVRFHYQLTVWIVVNVHLGFLPHRPWISIDRRHCEAKRNPPMQTCQCSLNETSCAHTFKTRENLLGQQSAVFTALDAFNDDRKLKVPLREALTVFSSGLRVRENTRSHWHGANDIIVLKML